jgi:endonuclease/exonuclease/phosphatase family metal-dependent hydrolase
LTKESTNTETAVAPKKRSWVRRVPYWISWVALGGLLVSCLAPLVSPAVFWPLAFFGLAYPAFVLLVFLLFIFWLLKRRRIALYLLGGLLLSAPYYNREFQFCFGKQEEAPASAFTVMSYNVKLFDLYNWSGNKQARSMMFVEIAREKPAVLSLQEFFNQDTGTFRNLDSLKKLLQLPYAHYEYTFTKHKDDHWGVVTFSRFPILNQGRIVFNNRNNNICIYTDLLINHDTIRVYNMHLQSINFGYADYETVNRMLKGDELEDEMESSKNILRRMKRAYTKRARQAESVALHIASCHYPIIVCGDFNDPPVSFTYRTVSYGLKDAFVESGSGFGKTFVNPFPVPRIDYILHSPNLKAWEFKTIADSGLSDHYAVKCKIGW